MLIRHPLQPHFRATVTARTPEQGGRKHPINWGYRPDLVFQADSKNYYGAVFATEELADAKAVAPGEAQDIDFYIRTAASEIMPRLEIGSTFTMNEGTRSVADCVITRIYRLDD